MNRVRKILNNKQQPIKSLQKLKPLASVKKASKSDSLLFIDYKVNKEKYEKDKDKVQDMSSLQEVSLSNDMRMIKGNRKAESSKPTIIKKLSQIKRKLDENQVTGRESTVHVSLFQGQEFTSPDNQSLTFDKEDQQKSQEWQQIFTTLSEENSQHCGDYQMLFDILDQ